MAESIQGICTYCGKVTEVTEDHVIPQCLFPNGIPADAPKVDACKYCNHVVKSELDTYLRDMLVTDMNSSQSPIAQQLFAKFSRSVVRNQSLLARDVLQKKQLVELHTQAGLFVDLAYTSKDANEKIQAAIAMDVRGLYRFYTGKMLPQDIPFEGGRIRDFEKLGIDVRILLESGASYVRIGDGNVFECMFAESPTRLGKSVWILSFLRRAVFTMFTSFQTTQTAEEDKAPLGKQSVL